MQTEISKRPGFLAIPV